MVIVYNSGGCQLKIQKKMLGVEPPPPVSKETRVQLNPHPDATSPPVGWLWHKKVPGPIGVFCPHPPLVFCQNIHTHPFENSSLPHMMTNAPLKQVSQEMHFVWQKLICVLCFPFFWDSLPQGSSIFIVIPYMGWLWKNDKIIMMGNLFWFWFKL